MDRLFSSKWMKIAAVVIGAVVIAVISSITTYLFALWELPEATEEGTEAPRELEAKEKDVTEADVFSEMTKKLKRKARSASYFTGREEQKIAIMNIGESLKELLAFDGSHLLTNDTFNSDEFSVIVSDYPLSRGFALRKINYTLKLRDTTNGTPYDESRFFLQYSGETSFFSEIEYLWPNEKAFTVFEKEDGCFAFSIATSDDHTTFNTSKNFTNYQATVYVPRDNVFTVEQYVDIPMKVISGRNLELIKENDTIKAVIPDYWETPACVFNSAKLTFERSKSEVKSKPVDYDMPGLLLGLSDSNGNIRTLFIRKEDDRIYVDEYAGEIVFSRKGELFSLKHYMLQEDFYRDEFGNETEYRTGVLDIQKLLCAPLGVDLTADFNRIFASKLSWGYCHVTDVPLYVGEDYVCYLQNSSQSGGGSWRESPSRIRFDKLDDLAEFTYAGSEWHDYISPSFEETTLAEVVYSKKAKDLFQSDIYTYGGETHPYVDFTQLSLKRNLGEWSLMLPILEDYFHPGNGSYSNWVKTFAVYSKEVPPFLASTEEIVHLGGWNNWNAKDLFKFPGSDASLFQFDYFIGICSQNSDPWEASDYDISIPVDLDECIVSISFADSDMQKAWMNELNKAG